LNYFEAAMSDQINNNRPITIFRWIAKLGAAGFLVGISMFATTALLAMDRNYLGPLFFSSLVITTLSVIAHIAALVGRELANAGWRFNIRALLIATTLIAALLGILVAAS
jgi:hypothetical protein